MENEQIKIDPEKFAYHFIDSISVPNEKAAFEDNAKNKLVAFLAAYYLIKRFNTMEKDVFAQSEVTRLNEMSYRDLLKEVSKLSYF